MTICWSLAHKSCALLPVDMCPRLVSPIFGCAPRGLSRKMQTIKIGHLRRARFKRVMGAVQCIEGVVLRG
jgi:hypothetical protein